MIQVIGDDIYYCGEKVATILAIKNKSLLDSFVEDIESIPNYDCWIPLKSDENEEDNE